MTLDSTLILQKAYVAGVAQPEREGGKERLEQRRVAQRVGRQPAAHLTGRGSCTSQKRQDIPRTN